ncbi:hypothetical protein LCGC14_1807060, partial [marine sediment metagenome]
MSNKSNYLIFVRKMTDKVNNKKMKYGLLMPHGGPSLNTPQKVTKYAIIAEQSGWDAFFIWDSISALAVDPWVTLASIAMSTKKIKIGAMVTPVARRRPWKLAKEGVSLDQLSHGRLIFGAGLGDDPVFGPYGEDTDKKVRAKKLDEGLDILNQLWSGEAVNFDGKYFNITDITYDRPIQSPRIPIWIGGLWPNKAPFRRAAKWDGMMPHTVRSVKKGGEIETEEIKGMRFPAKTAARAFVNKKERFEMIAEDSHVFVTNHKLDNPYDVVGIINNVKVSKLIIIAPDFSEQVLFSLIQTIKNGIFVYPVKCPALRTEQLEDLAVYTGA